jgi:ABC-type transport system involved in multi-copper enzyme maturation permease subunit
MENPMFCWPLVNYVLMAALRDRVLLATVILAGVAVAMSMFVGSAAVVEKTQFVTVFAAGSLRLLCVAAIVLFTAFFIRRSFDQRDVEFLLTRPLSRASFIVAHALAIAVIGVVLAIVAAVAMVLITSLSSLQAFPLWGVSLALETMVMGFVALFFGMVLSSATTSALFAMAFYVLGRMMGQVLSQIETHVAAFKFSGVMEFVMQIVSVIVPRFDLMTQTSWLIYGPQGHEGFAFLFAQAGAFGLLVVSAAIIDLVRRQF